MKQNKRYRKVEQFRPLLEGERETLLLGNFAIMTATWIMLLANNLLSKAGLAIFVGLSIGGLFNIVMFGCGVKDRVEWYEEIK